jgi:hypothetical protein
MGKTTHTLFPAHVPKLARIIELLGGLDLAYWNHIEFVISLDGEEILGPWDFDCGCPEHVRERERIGYPDLHDENHTFKALHFTLITSGDDFMEVEIALTARVHGEPFAERGWCFQVPSEGWESGRWLVEATCTQQPYLPAEHQVAWESEEEARQLAEEATAFDREDPVVAGALRLVEKQTPQELRTKFATHLWWKDLRFARRERDK